jgi:hypothetical protein
MMSSLQDANLMPVSTCIDGKFQLPGEGWKNTICHTRNDKAPWLALDFGEQVEVTSVTMYNRNDANAQRLQNVEVRVLDSLPTNGNDVWMQGTLMGKFAGPGTLGQVITVSTSDSWFKSIQGTTIPKGR